MNDLFAPMSSTPNLDDVARALRFLMRVSVLITGVVAAVLSFCLLGAVVGLLNRLGLDGALANMLMMLLSPGVLVAGIAATAGLERLQERRLHASLEASAIEARALSASATSTAVPAMTAAVIDVDTKET